MNISVRFLFTALFFCAHLNAEIIEIFHFKELLRYVTHQNILIALDLDNTLIEPQDEIGSDQWFSYHLEQKIKQNMTVQEALHELLPLYFSIMLSKKMKPVEHVTPSLIKYLQEQNIMIIGLTARSLELIASTHTQLAQNGIDLLVTAPHKQHFLVAHEHHVPYENGIIFCNGHQDKGSILKAFLNQINYEPHTIIVVDDKEKYLHSVERAFENSAKKIICLRYAHLDEKVKTFWQQTESLAKLETL